MLPFFDVHANFQAIHAMIMPEAVGVGSCTEVVFYTQWIRDRLPMR